MSDSEIESIEHNTLTESIDSIKEELENGVNAQLEDLENKYDPIVDDLRQKLIDLDKKNFEICKKLQTLSLQNFELRGRFREFVKDVIRGEVKDDFWYLIFLSF